MKIVVATKNPGKLREFRRILEPFGYEIVSQADLGIEGQAEETGSTFAENAKLKAEYVFDRTGMITIADDSGLCVDALDGRPGVFSARYGGPSLDDRGRVRKLLDEMDGVPEENRAAHFTCAVVVRFPDREWEIVQHCYGHIGYEPVGEDGFGYDPVFLLEDGRSFAQISPEEKDAVSHRGKALREMRSRFEKEKLK